MSQAASGSVVRQFESLLAGGAVAGLTDRQLIDRFNARRDEAGEAAFAAIVQRHGPMVLEVCRQLLGDPHHGEDAFQAVFLVLARKAGSLHDPDRLGPWLYGVAIRTARKSRARLARLRRNEEGGPMTLKAPEPAAPIESTAPSAERSAIDREQAAALLEEIDRLPSSFRLPVVLCYFEGLTLDEAARRLRWPAGTVRSRLARARDKLRAGLTRRGVVLPAVAIAGGLGPRPAASVPAALCAATTGAAMRYVAGEVVSAAASALAREVLRSMALRQSGLVGTIMLAGVAVGAGLLGRTLAVGDGPGRERPAPEAAAIAVARPQESATPPAGEESRPVRSSGRPLSPWGERVDRSIRGGVRFLQQQQRPDGSWPELAESTRSGCSTLATLALLTAGEKPDSPTIRKALEFLRRFGPDDLDSTYTIALQTMVFAAAEPARDRDRIAANARWLQAAQIRPGDGFPGPGSWGYNRRRAGSRGDNSNAQYALLGLQAAREAGVAVDPEVWRRARDHWLRGQQPDGGWSYTPELSAVTASMTCAGVASLSLDGLRRFQGRESLRGETILDCGQGAFDRNVLSGLDWLAGNFQVTQNTGAGRSWKYYYLYGLERAGRLAGVRFLGAHDWFREGADQLVRDQDPTSGAWQGDLIERDRILATSFALLFLGRGRTPVLINKLRHRPLDDWGADPDDVANLVEAVGRDWKIPLTWQVVDSGTATVPDLLRAPVLFLTGHKAPEFSPAEKQNLRDYVDRGGFLLVDACCGAPDFDRGFRELMKAILPEGESELRPLDGQHPIWHAREALDPAGHPLWGIRRGGRTAVVYSAKDLSCYWNHVDQAGTNPAVRGALDVGRNVVDYATGRRLPPDKLSDP